MAALVLLALAVGCAAQDPTAIYDGGFGRLNSTIELRIGNGGAGQSGLIEGKRPAHLTTTEKRLADSST